MNPTSRHILLADDNPVNRKVLQHMLGRLGHTVEPVTTGKEAFEKASSSSYDLIFMDMMMPVMDGLEATRLIRQYEEGRRQRLQRSDMDQCVSRLLASAV